MLSKAPVPYIGVAAVTSRQQAEELLSDFADDMYRIRNIGIGVGVSSKTIDGQQTRHPKRLLPFRPSLFNIFPEGRTFNIVHYNCADVSRMFYDLVRIVDLGFPNMHAIQVNQPTDAASHNALAQLQKFHNEGHSDNLRIILQVKTRELGLTGDILTWLTPYVPYITDVLLDVSLGAGRELTYTDVGTYIEVIKMISERYPALGIGVAGGLYAGNLHMIQPLFEVFPRLSIDAEGRLRNRVDDTLNMTLAHNYILDAYSMAFYAQRYA